MFSPSLSNSKGESITPNSDLSFGFEGLEEKYADPNSNKKKDNKFKCVN